MKMSTIYKILYYLDKTFMNLYRVEYNGIENIKKLNRENGYILAGNHTNNLDSLLLVTSINRQIHFLAKIELFHGFLKLILNSIGTIPVDRSKKNPNAIKQASKYLKNNEIICIFPEGTINRTEDIILPFKIGTSKLSNENNVAIVPFVIKGKYKMFKKSVSITFGELIYPTGNIEKDSIRLENYIKEMLIS